MVALDKFMINARSPLFHGNPNYDELGLMDYLKKLEIKEQPDYDHRLINPQLNYTEKMVLKAAYPTYPNFKTEFLGLSKLAVFWPNNPTEETDQLAVRTREGAMASAKGEVKGMHVNMPTTFPEVKQRVDTKGQEVIKGIYEVHVNQQSLATKSILFQKSQ